MSKQANTDSKRHTPFTDRAHLVAGIALFGCVLCWSAVPVLLKQLVGSINAWSANGFRYPLAAVLFWPILISAARRKKLNRRVVARCLIPGILAMVGQMFWATAPYHLKATSIGFLVRMSVVWSLILALFLFADERRLLKAPRFYLGMLLTLTGFGLLVSASTTSVNTVGVLIMLGCSFFFACYGISVRYFLQGIHPLVSFGVVAQIVSVGTITAMLVLGQQDYSSVKGPDWVLLVVSALLGIACGHILLYTAVLKLGPTIATTVQSVTPFGTMALAMLFLGESMQTVEFAAGIIMVAGALTLVFLKK